MRWLQHQSPGSDAELAIYSLCDKCPFLPPANSTVVNPSVFLPGDSQVLFAAIVSRPVAHAQIEPRFHISFERSHQKRGPPSFLS